MYAYMYKKEIKHYENDLEFQFKVGLPKFKKQLLI